MRQKYLSNKKLRELGLFRPGKEKDETCQWVQTREEGGVRKVKAGSSEWCTLKGWKAAGRSWNRGSLTEMKWKKILSVRAVKCWHRLPDRLWNLYTWGYSGNRANTLQKANATRSRWRCWRTSWGLFQPHPPCDPHRQKQIICLRDDPGSPAHQRAACT